MKHQELLDKIDAIPLGIEHIPLKDALVDVVKAHTPFSFFTPETGEVTNCVVCGGRYYPCYTIDRIQVYFP